MRSLKMMVVLSAFAFPVLSTYSYGDNIEVPSTEEGAEAVFVLDEDAVEVTETEAATVPSTISVEIVAEEGDTITVEPTPATNITVAESPTVAENPATSKVEADEPKEELSEEMKRFREQARIVVEEQNKLFAPHFKQIATNKNAIAVLEGRVDEVEKKLEEALKIKDMLGNVQTSIAGLNESIPKMVRETLDGKANEVLAKSGLDLDSAKTSVSAKPSTAPASSTVSNGVKRVTAAELHAMPGYAKVMWKSNGDYTNIYFQNGKLMSSVTNTQIDRNSVGELVSKKGDFDAPYQGQYQSMPTTYSQTTPNYSSTSSYSYPATSYPQNYSYAPMPLQVGGGCRNCQ